MIPPETIKQEQAAQRKQELAAQGLAELTRVKVVAEQRPVPYAVTTVTGEEVTTVVPRPEGGGELTATTIPSSPDRFIQEVSSSFQQTVGIKPSDSSTIDNLRSSTVSLGETIGTGLGVVAVPFIARAGGQAVKTGVQTSPVVRTIAKRTAQGIPFSLAAREGTIQAARRSESLEAKEILRDKDFQRDFSVAERQTGRFTGGILPFDIKQDDFISNLESLLKKRGLSDSEVQRRLEVARRELIRQEGGQLAGLLSLASLSESVGRRLVPLAIGRTESTRTTPFLISGPSPNRIRAQEGVLLTQLGAIPLAPAVLSRGQRFKTGFKTVGALGFAEGASASVLSDFSFGVQPIQDISIEKALLAGTVGFTTAGVLGGATLAARTSRGRTGTTFLGRVIDTEEVFGDIISDVAIRTDRTARRAGRSLLETDFSFLAIRGKKAQADFGSIGRSGGSLTDDFIGRTPRFTADDGLSPVAPSVRAVTASAPRTTVPSLPRSTLISTSIPRNTLDSSIGKTRTFSLSQGDFSLGAFLGNTKTLSLSQTLSTSTTVPTTTSVPISTTVPITTSVPVGTSVPISTSVPVSTAVPVSVPTSISTPVSVPTVVLDLRLPNLGKRRTPEGKSKAGYYVKIRDKGTFKRFISTPLEKSQAKKLGRYVVDNTTAATFKIKAANKKAQRLDKFIAETPKDKFRTQTRKGKKQYIEKNTFRIDTIGELKGITYKGLREKEFRTRERNQKQIFGF